VTKNASRNSGLKRRLVYVVGTFRVADKRRSENLTSIGSPEFTLLEHVHLGLPIIKPLFYIPGTSGALYRQLLD
jgi:hypothetical protein